MKELSNSKVPSIAFDSLIEEIYSMVNSEISSLLNRHKLMEYFQVKKQISFQILIFFLKLGIQKLFSVIQRRIL